MLVSSSCWNFIKIIIVIYMIPTIHKDLLEEKSRKWRQMNQRRYGEKRKFGYVDA